MEPELPPEWYMEQQQQRYKAMPQRKRKKLYTLSHLDGTDQKKALAIIQQWVQENGRIWSRKVLYVLVSHQLLKDTSEGEYGKAKTLAQSWRFYGMMPYSAFRDKRTTVRDVGIKDKGDFNTQFRRLCKYYNRSARNLQDYYVEVWTEKELPDTTQDMLQRWDIGTVMGEGFIGDIPFHDAIERVKNIRREHEKPVVILYISDYDPEGQHTYNIAVDKLQDANNGVTVDKIFLTKPQIHEHDFIPNEGYAERMRKGERKDKHWRKQYVRDFVRNNKDLGHDGWVQYEFDQVPVSLLNKELERRISQYVDMELIKSIEKECRKEVQEWLKDKYNGDADAVLKE